tara:strand:+ start:37 stop:333 length:297 start_codon:yes stop_codon:yes gene_type:complete
MTQLKPGTLCPLIGENCRGLECSWYTQVRGTNPQTGEEVDEWGCAVTWLPVLLIENSQQQRQTGAAVESFRNESVNTRNMLAAMTELPKLKPIIEHDN